MINEPQTIIIVLTVLGSVFGFYTKLKKDIINEEKAKQETMRELTTSIIKLDSSIGFLNRTIDALKERVTNHGKELDILKIETKGQEERIRALEEHCKTCHKVN